MLPKRSLYGQAPAAEAAKRPPRNPTAADIAENSANDRLKVLHELTFGKRPGKMKPLNVRLPVELIEAATKAAADAGMSLSEWIRSAMQEKLR